MTTEQESNVEPKKEEKNDEFLIPKLPVKKPQQPVVAEQPKVKSAINKFNSLIPPSVESYVAPSWAEIPESSDHTIEIMNNGVIEKNYKLKELAKHSYITVGRMDTCDIVSSIPGASRIHCWLQYGDGYEGRGWYVYDLASTQGTYVNKKEVPKKVYYKVRPGSIIQITKSNFHLFLEGTDQQIQRAMPAEDTQRKSPEPNFLDDLKAKTERSFEKDPLTMLSRFCEREGIEYKFAKLAGDAKEKSYTYAFELPDDVCSGQGGSFTGIGADVQSAQTSCALQVCKHLNELDLLASDSYRGASKNIQDNDFYEEEEDLFYDRTGQIEAQRLKRIERHKASVGIKSKALTYQELLDKIKQLEDSQQAVSEQLGRLVKPADGVKVSPEELDVSSLSASLSVRLEISKLKRKYEQLSSEIKLLQKAAEVAKPFEDTKMLYASSHSIKQTAQPTIQVQAAEELPESSKEKPKKSVETEAANEQSNKPSTSQESEELMRGPALSEVEKVGKLKPVEGPGGKKFGLLTRKDLQAQKNASKNKRKMADEFDDDEVLDEKRNKTDEFEDPHDIVDWKPPSNQTGDGRLPLNDKLGY